MFNSTRVNEKTPAPKKLSLYEEIIMRDKDTELLAEAYTQINEEFNNRVKFMMEVWSEVTGNPVQTSEFGYNEIGRSSGILRDILNPNNIPKLVEVANRYGVDLSQVPDLPREQGRQEVVNWFMRTSR